MAERQILDERFYIGRRALVVGDETIIDQQQINKFLDEYCERYSDTQDRAFQLLSQVEDLDSIQLSQL